jgi:sterol carrier protein 2
VYTLGQTGIPIFNTTNNGCTGATAVYLAKSAIQAGSADCVIAVGFEKMFAAGLKF